MRRGHEKDPRLFITKVEDDKTPTLGGDLDANGQNVENVGALGAATAAVGSGDNYTEFEADGTMEMHGDATMWDDMMVDITAIRLAGTADPAFERFSGGLYLYSFSHTKTNEVFMVVQMSHRMKLGSVIYPHVHLAPETDVGGSIEWGLEYEWCNIGQRYGSPTTIYTGAVGLPLAAKHHAIASFAGIAPSTAQGGISSILVCRLFRDPARVNDTYNDKIWLLGFDIHIEINTLGSRQEFVK